MSSIDTEAFLQTQNLQEGRFEILEEAGHDNDNTELSGQVVKKQYATKAIGFITSGGIGWWVIIRGEQESHLAEQSFVWSDESFDLKGKKVEFVLPWNVCMGLQKMNAAELVVRFMSEDPSLLLERLVLKSSSREEASESKESNY